MRFFRQVGRWSRVKRNKSSSFTSIELYDVNEIVFISRPCGFALILPTSSENWKLFLVKLVLRNVVNMSHLLTFGLLLRAHTTHLQKNR